MISGRYERMIWWSQEKRTINSSGEDAQADGAGDGLFATTGAKFGVNMRCMGFHSRQLNTTQLAGNSSLFAEASSASTSSSRAVSGSSNAWLGSSSATSRGAVTSGAAASVCGLYWLWARSCVAYRPTLPVPATRCSRSA